MNTPDTLPETITPFTTDGADKDWQTVRDEAVGGLRDGSWTDHNVSDPGITMLEAGAAVVAEAHLRTAMTDFALAPIGSAAWRDNTQPAGVALPTESATIASLARELSLHDGAIRDHIGKAPGQSEAVAAVAADPLIDLSPAHAAVAVHLHRSRTVAKASFDHAGAVDAAVEAVGDSSAADLLRLDPSFDELWDSELLEVLELRRRRRLAVRLADLQRAIAGATTEPEVDAIVGSEPLNLDERLGASGLMARPELPPEAFEASDGTTQIWPPTAIQTRSVEPVSGPDYARLALAVPGVRRAWVRTGQMVGTAWDGTSITTASQHPGAVTILIEPTDDADADIEQQTLRALAGPGETAEIDDPFALYRSDPSRLVPRRMICDEIGVAQLGVCDVEVRAALHVAVGTVADRASIIAAAHARVAALLLDGRPESQAPVVADDRIDGPWPVPAAAPPGWIPGEPIRLNEVIQLLGEDPNILGVSEVGLRRPGGAWFQPGPDDVAEFPLDPSCVPRLSDSHCLTVAFVLQDDV